MSQEVDVVVELSKLTVRTIRALGNAGEAEREQACKFAGEAWALLHERHPDAAERMNGVLHFLTGPRFNKPDASDAEASLAAVGPEAEASLGAEASPAAIAPAADSASTAAAASVSAAVGFPVDLTNVGSGASVSAGAKAPIERTNAGSDAPNREPDRQPAGEVSTSEHPWLPAPETLQTEADVAAYYRKVSDKAAAGKDFDMEVRHLIPADRHRLIIDAFNKLSPKQGFVLVNDHDPKPLYYQFAFEYADRFTWDPIEEGPDVWRVRIGRR